MANRDMVNINSIRAFCVGIYQELGDGDYVLVESGRDSIAYYKDNLSIVVEDFEAGRIRVAMRIQPLSQLRNIDMPIEVIFNAQ